MIDLYYWPTPNGHKVTLFLEEAAVPYRIIPINIGKGEQFTPEFLKIGPNNRIPAIVDTQPKGAAEPVSLFESGAILLYLADKTGRFIAADTAGRADVLQWLFWQMGGLGPMAGQAFHFRLFAQEKLPYAIARYTNETNRLFAVANRRLADRAFLAGAYSIADMACYPWVIAHERLGQDMDDFPHLKRWMEEIRARPATAAAYAKGDPINATRSAVPTEEERKVLYGQTASVVKPVA
jgi:GST-like protein